MHSVRFFRCPVPAQHQNLGMGSRFNAVHLSSMILQHRARPCNALPCQLSSVSLTFGTCSAFCCTLTSVTQLHCGYPLPALSFKQAACAGETTPEKDPERPISATIIADCVKQWTAANKVTIGAKWAYDGRNNLYAPQTLVEHGETGRDGYQEFPLEFKDPEKRNPSRYLCAASLTCKWLCGCMWCFRFVPGVLWVVVVLCCPASRAVRRAQGSNSAAAVRGSHDNAVTALHADKHRDVSEWPSVPCLRAVYLRVLVLRSA